MPITLITGPANAGKAQVVLDAVRRELAHREEPVLVVPTAADVEHYLRELAGEAVVLGARVMRFDGLIAEAVARAQVAEQPLGRLARTRVIASVLSRSPLADDAPEGPAPGLVAAAEALIVELRERRLTPSRLTAALARWDEQAGQDRRGEAIAGIYAEYCRELARLGRADAQQRAALALDRLRRTPALWGGIPVAFYGFDDLAPLQLDTIETLGRVVGARVTVSLAYEPGRFAFAGRAGAFAQLQPIADEHHSLAARADYYAPAARPALSHLERSLFEAEAPAIDPHGAVRMLEGGGERAELELLAREIRALIEEGTPAEEIALVTRARGALAGLLEEVLAAAGIPLAIDRRRRLADTALGRALIGLLRCAGEEGGPQDGWLGDLLAWLRAPGLLERPELADGLELAARRAGVERADEARALWQQRHWPLDTIDHLREAAARSPVALIDRTVRELQWLFAAPRRGAAAVLDEAEAEDARALSAAAAALAELRELARLAPELAPARAPELAATLTSVEVFVGRRAGPGAVAVVDPLALRARRVRAVFVSSLQEGVFPTHARPRTLLSDEDRREIGQASGLQLGREPDQLAVERYLLYAVVSRPQELLVLSWHLADDDGEPTARSLFVDDIEDLFGASLGERRLRRPLGAADGHAGGSLAAGPAPGGAKVSDERVLAQLRERPWSASSLETWIGCPMRWFVQRLLRPERLEPEPEPLARGGLAHAALNDTLEGLRRETGSARVTPARLGRARELLVESLERREDEDPLSVAPERRRAARRRLRADLELYLDYAAETTSPLEPKFLEIGFGITAADDRGEPSSLPAYELAPGSPLRGRIDRVDVGEGGEAVVFDYKSRFAPAPAKWLSEGKLQVALYMRAVEQLLGLPVVGGFYQPLSGTDLRPRGVLDLDAGVELDCVRGDAREQGELQELLDGALAEARLVVAQAGAGELEARPRTCLFGEGRCEFPAICRCER